MAYLGIDRKRFTYLLSLGTDEFELKQFFTECRAQLILHGGKVQNLPHGLTARIRTLAFDLPPSTDQVVRAWFAKHVTMAAPEEAEAVVDAFKHYEELEEDLPEDAARRCARSCLVHLFSKNPPVTLLDFLKTTIGGSSGGEEDAAPPTEPRPQTLQAETYPAQLPHVLVNLVEGRDADEHLEGLPTELATFIAGLQAAAQDRMKEAQDAIETLSCDSVLRTSLERFVKRQESKRASRDTSPRGLRIVGREIFEGAFDCERDEVLAYCATADRTTAVFVHPIAVVRGGRAELLTEETRKKSFPESGDLIAFLGLGHPRQPRRGEMGVWRVAEHETEKATHFHLASEKRSVYEIRTVPFPSTEYDSVREFLKDHAVQAGKHSLQPFLFLLDDGLIVGARGEATDLSKDETFVSGLLAWNSLPALRLEGRLFALGPLPKEQSVFECADLSATVRKLFRPFVRGAKGDPGRLTRAQLSELAESLGSGETGLDMLRIQRIKGELGRLGEHGEALEALVSTLMDHPIVKTRIDELVQQEAAKLLEQKNSLRTDILRLQKERAEWEGRIRKLEEEHHKVGDETSKVVKAAFEKARTQGVARLAEVAIFQALSTPQNVPLSTTASLPVRSASIAQPNVRDLAPSDRDVISTLRTLGVQKQQATAFALLGEVALECGLMLCVKGVAARRAVEDWASAIGKSAVLFDSTVGLLDDNSIKDVLARDPSPDVLAVLDANLSALDIYARPLSDLVLARVTEPTPGPRPTIVLALAEGVGSLPLPKTFERISISIDLDERYDFGGISDDEGLRSEVVNPDNGSLYRRLWRPAADSVCKQIEGLEPEQRVLVLSIWASQNSD